MPSASSVQHALDLPRDVAPDAMRGPAHAGVFHREIAAPTASSFLFQRKGTISGRPGYTYKAWAQEAADAASEAMKTARNAELAAGQARRFKYFAKSARDAAQNALKEMESHLAKDRADPKKMHIYSAETPVWTLALPHFCEVSSHKAQSDFL